LRQPLVTRKHKKLRAFRRLYPECQIELLYRRDYEALRAGGAIPAIAAYLAGSAAATA
jgi:hypothetical protein